MKTQWVVWLQEPLDPGTPVFPRLTALLSLCGLHPKIPRGGQVAASNSKSKAIRVKSKGTLGGGAGGGGIKREGFF